MVVTGVSEFERFFRSAAELDVDKQDLKRLFSFLDQKLSDILIMGVASARANLRPSIEPFDLPITKGLQEMIHQFETIANETGLDNLLSGVVHIPQLDLALGFETEARVTAIAGGITLALARAFKVIDPKLVNPSTKHWEQAFELFNLLL